MSVSSGIAAPDAAPDADCVVVRFSTDDYAPCERREAIVEIAGLDDVDEVLDAERAELARLHDVDGRVEIGAIGSGVGLTPRYVRRKRSQEKSVASPQFPKNQPLVCGSNSSRMAIGTDSCRGQRGCNTAGDGDERRPFRSTDWTRER